MNAFHLIVPPASSLALRYDVLFYTLIGLCAVVALGIFISLTWFSVKYRRGSSADRSNAQNQSLGVEIAWTAIPLVTFLGIFVWAAFLFERMQTPPADALPIYVVAKQWMWRVQHPDGRREIDALHVPLGRAVKLVMTSQDVIHSFFVPAFRLKQDVLPGRYTTMWFTATTAGDYPLFCAEYCGADHSGMEGRVTVLPPAQYETWLRSGDHTEGMAAAGFARFRELGCSGCHGENSKVHAPSLERVYGHTVQLQDGRSIVADEPYIRDSILLPRKDVVAGFEPIMPSFAGQVSEDDLLELIAYIQSIGEPQAGAAGVSPPSSR